MANEIDIDSLSDEEFMAHLEEPQEMESEEEIAEDNKEVDTGVDTENDEEEDSEEDTDTQDDSEEDETDDTETNDLNDEEGDDTDEPDEDDEDDASEENTLDGDDSNEPDADVAKDESDEEDTKDQSDGDDTDTTEVNYKEQYEKFKNFYDEVTSEFTANGKTVKGFTDPKKIIQSQQMSAGFSDKMAGFKKYRPFMSPLKERGMLDNPEKFDLAMNLADGDVEALKQHIKNLEIDPVELDMETINYDGKSQLASQAEITLDDVMDSADASGIKDKVQDVLGQQWDRESVVDLLKDPQSGSDLIEHINSGVFDAVQDKISEKKRLDVNGAFSNQNSISQYRQAAAELESEYRQSLQNQEQKAVEDKVNTDKIDAEKIAAEAKKKEYKAKVEKKNKEASDARKKATSVSKKRTTVKNKKRKEFDPMSLNDEEFTAYLDKQIYK